MTVVLHVLLVLQKMGRKINKNLQLDYLFNFEYKSEMVNTLYGIKKLYIHTYVENGRRGFRSQLNRARPHNIVEYLTKVLFRNRK